MTPAERLRKNQRSLDKAIRELDQVRVKLEKQEKTLVTQIRQSAQKNQMGAAKIQAKDLVRTRRCRRPYCQVMNGTGQWLTLTSTDISRSSTACGASCRKSPCAYRYASSGLTARMRIALADLRCVDLSNE